MSSRERGGGGGKGEAGGERFPSVKNNVTVSPCTGDQEDNYGRH